MVAQGLQLPRQLVIGSVQGHVMSENREEGRFSCGRVNRVAKSYLNLWKISIPVPLVAIQKTPECCQHASIDPFRCVALWRVSRSLKVSDPETLYRFLEYLGHELPNSVLLPESRICKIPHE